MGSQKSPNRPIKRVLFVARRTAWRRIQSIEAVPLGFDVWPFGARKTRSPEHLNSALVHLMKRRQRSNVVRRSREGDVDARERIGFLFNADSFSALVKRCSNCAARLVKQLTDDRALLIAERFHPLAPFGDAAAFTE